MVLARGRGGNLGLGDLGRGGGHGLVRGHDLLGARRGRRGGGGLSPVTEPLNSRMPRPSERPTSGSFSVPKISRTTASSRMMWMGEGSNMRAPSNGCRGGRRADATLDLS